MARKPIEFEDHPMEFPDKPLYRAYCKHVVDGDTVDVFVDLGLLKYAYESIRLEGINTPEIYRPKTGEEREAGYKAKEFVESKILNKQVKIETLKDKQTFGRFRANIYFYEDGTWKSLADELRSNGYDWSEK